MVANLFYKYPSTSMIRFKASNVFTNDRGLYLFITKRLKFIVPEKFCIIKDKHVYIPNSIYQQELIKYYKTVSQ